MSYIPQASINDLIDTHHSATSAKSATSPNPISDFINMLGRYAQQANLSAGKAASDAYQKGENWIGKNVGQPITDAVNQVGKAAGNTNFTGIPGMPTASQAFNAVNSQVNDSLPGGDVLEGRSTPMSLALLGGTLAMGGENPEEAIKNPEDIVKTGEKRASMGQSIEAMNDAAGGWKTGQKAQFDQALANGDSNTVQKLLPNVPDYYKTRMNDRISSIKPQYAYDNQATATIPPGGEQLPPLGAKKTQGLPPIGDNPQNAGNPPPISQKPSMITKNQADPQTIAKMSLNFDVPRRIAQNQMVKPETVMNQLIDDGISGRNLNDLQGTADSITGEKGAFPQINNYILKSIKTPIDYTDAINAKTTNLSSVLEGEKQGFINTINQEVNKAMEPLNYNTPGQLPSELPEGQAYATDLFQTSQNLRNISRMYMRKAYTDMGELNHPEMERAANAIMEIKNNIDDAIDKNVPSGTYQAFKSDPFVQQQLQRVPPKVAQRFLAGADRFKDGQTIQAPYVNLSHMIEDTKDTQLSVWTKAAKAMQGQNVSGNVANTVKENIPGPKILKNAVGGIVGAAAKPFDKTPEDIFQENMSGKGNISGAKFPGGTTGKVIAGIGLAGAAGAGLESLKSSANNQSDNHTGNSQNPHSDNILNTPLSVNSQLETNISKVDPSSTPADPRTITGSDGKSLAMSDGQYQTATAALDALVKQDPSYITNPIKAGQLKAAQDAINTKYSASQKLMNSYQKVSTVSQKIADAQSLLKETSPVLTDKIGFLEGGHEMLDPKYQSLVNDLNFIENSDPRLKGQLSNLATGGSVKTALDNAAKLLLSEHNQLLKSYGAGTPTATSAKATTPSQIPAGLPAPVDGALPPMHTGSYQFTAPNPMFQ